MALRDLRFAMYGSLHPGLIDQASSEIACRVFENRTCALLRRLCSLPVLFMIFDNRFEPLRTFAVQPHAQLDDNFGWLNQSTWRHDRISVRIKCDVPACTKATLTITQVYFIMHIAPHHWDGNARLVQRTAARIYYFNPGQHFTQLAIVRTRVRDDASAEGARNARPKFKTTPALHRQFIQQARPASAGFSDQ